MPQTPTPIAAAPGCFRHWPPQPMLPTFPVQRCQTDGDQLFHCVACGDIRCYTCPPRPPQARAA